MIPKIPLASLNEIHVFTIHIDQWRARLKDMIAILSPDELKRSAAFRFDADRESFTITRAALRQILSLHLELLPEEIQFHYTPNGKPFVHSDIQFSVSHSANIAVFAITKSADIGIDVEHARDNIDIDSIAARVFSPSDRAKLLSLEPRARLDHFLHLWTQMEAFAKAQGTGLPLLDHGPITLAKSWSHHHFRPAPGYLACLATSLPAPDTRFIQI